MIDLLIERLKDFQIKNIVTIDDDWNSDNADFIEFEGNNIWDFLEKYKIIYSPEERTVINNEAISTMKEFMENSNNLFDDLKKRISDNISGRNKLDPSLIALDAILKKINETEDVAIIYSDKKDVELSKLNGNTLFILDKNMGRDDEDILIEKIKSLSNINDEITNLILIYSNECGTDFDTHKNKLKYLKDKMPENEYAEKLWVLYQLWAIKKIGDQDALVESLHNMLLSSLYGVSLLYFLNGKINARRNALERLSEIDIEEMNGAFIDAYIEGERLDDIIERIMLTLENDEITKQYNEQNMLMNAIKNIEKYGKHRLEIINHDACNGDYTKYIDEHRKNTICNSTKNHAAFGIADYTINVRYKDISTGDLFKWKEKNGNTWKYGMVISQECNNVIRIPRKPTKKDAMRNNIKFNLLVLESAEISTEISNTLFQKINSQLATKIWPIKDGDQYYCFRPTEEIFIIDANIADVCSLNNEGRGRLSEDISEALVSKGYHSKEYFNDFYNNTFWKEFYRDMYNEIDKYISVFFSFVDKEQNERLGEIKEHNKLKEITIEAKTGIAYKDNEFSLQRICRIEPKRTLLAIQDYIYKISKTGANPVDAWDEIE